ncbi:MAG TPA: hypothetical protein VG096_06175 [Bryobacteraceae bacterium]|jgi:hypothetical protein|nr:hypothetical protein [Bryobacteraceae bacterium]
MSDNPIRETRAERKRRQMVAFNDALLAFPTIALAAKASGVSSRQASRWIKSPEFAAVYVESRRATMSSVAALLRAGSIGAAEALTEITKDPKAAPTARTAASRAVLDGLLRLTEVAELEERVRSLEALAGERK